MNVSTASRLGALALLAACAHSEKVMNQGTGLSTQEQLLCAPEPRVAFSDGAADINPTPRDMTIAAFRALHAEITRIRGNTGRFPGVIEEVLSQGDQQGPIEPTSEWLMDGWGNRIRYTSADSTYVLSSAGGDERFGTNDDMRSTGPLRACVPRPPATE